jgi:hypothetical protein
LLNENLKRICPNLAVYMELMSNDKDLTMEEWISVMVDKAEEKAKSTDVFSDWEAKSKGADKGLSEAQLKELGDLRKEVAQLRKENTQLKRHPKPSDPSTSAAPFSRTACHKCGLEGHKKDSCPNKGKKALLSIKSSGCRTQGDYGYRICRQGGCCRSTTDRSNATFESSHLFWGLRQDSKTVLRNSGGKSSRLSTRSVLVQCEGWTLRELCR